MEFRIRNFALMDDVTVPFREGFNVITGETGAGKSVIVNALSLVLGAKAQETFVRSGADTARLDGVFRMDGGAGIASLLEEAGIEPEEDGVLTLTRELGAGGRSAARVNGKTVPVSLLRGLGEALVDLHGQYAHQTLLRRNDHTQFRDALAGVEKPRAAMSAAHRQLKDLRARQRHLRENRECMLEELERLEYRVKEIESLVTSEEDVARMREDALRLENVADLAAAVQRAYQLLSRNGDEDAALNQAERALAALRSVEGVEKQVDAAAARCEEGAVLLEEATRALGSLGHLLEADPETLRELQDRLVDIDALLRKTKSADAVALLAHRDTCREEAARLAADLHQADGLENEARRAEDEALKCAAALTAARKKTAGKMARAMEKELAALAMPGAKFEAALFPLESGEAILRNFRGHDPELQDEFRSCPRNSRENEKTILSEQGAERVEFLIAANPGEPPRPLARIASGGELSRVMLALKTLLADTDDVPVLVFDEIDAGIGGVTATTLAKKMQALAERRQVVAVTHLPQIAGQADFHVGAHKEQRAGRTVIRVGAVAGDARLKEMARMMGRDGRKPDEAKALAARMLREARRGNTP